MVVDRGKVAIDAVGGGAAPQRQEPMVAEVEKADVLLNN